MIIHFVHLLEHQWMRGYGPCGPALATRESEAAKRHHALNKAPMLFDCCHVAPQKHDDLEF